LAELGQGSSIPDGDGNSSEGSGRENQEALTQEAAGPGRGLFRERRAVRVGYFSERHERRIPGAKLRFWLLRLSEEEREWLGNTEFWIFWNKKIHFLMKKDPSN
jgi:hypothetical protein